MDKYERLLAEVNSNKIVVTEKHFKSKAKGLCKGNRIGISKALSTSAEKNCVLAEELGHYHTTVGNIIDQSKTNNIKQELKARIWAYKKLIPLSSLVQAFEEKVHNRYELAEYLEVTEDFIEDALIYYKQKYGAYTEVDGYVIMFEPLYVLKTINK